MAAPVTSIPARGISPDFETPLLPSWMSTGYETSSCERHNYYGGAREVVERIWPSYPKGRRCLAKLGSYPPSFGFVQGLIVGRSSSSFSKPETAASSFKVWNSLGESIATAAKPAKATSAAVVIANPPELSPEAKVSAASAITSGAVLGSFEELRFKSDSKNPVLNSIEIFGLGSGPELEEKLSQTVKLASGVMFAKQLVNAPPNVLIPSVLADEAENLAAEFSDVLTAKILDEEACKELKMGSYLGVPIASTNPPKFIHLQYKPPTGEVKTKLAIVGKGLTFDSGGYNLKTGAGSIIELMKFDMGGAAAAIGAAKAVAAVKPLGIEVQCVSQAERGTALLFNCQMGRGRTTTGIVIATLIHLRRTGFTGIPRTSSTGLVHELAEEAMDEVPDPEEACRRGEYTGIQSLVRVLEGEESGTDKKVPNKSPHNLATVHACKLAVQAN
ncbi:unnamed protein product [Calypogeia fissa]